MVCKACILCEEGGGLSEASEVVRISSNVRRFRDEWFTVWRCPKCGSLHSKEEVDLDYYYRYYPAKSQTLSYAYRQAFKNRLKFLLRIGIKKTDALLDYGSGTGLFVSFLRDQGFSSADGYDPYLSDSKPVTRQYHVITLQDVIEHVEDPFELVERVKQLLLPGGIVVVGTPNASELDLRQPEVYARELHQPYHRHILSEPALNRLFGNAGFVPIGLSRRLYFDTLLPCVNSRFIGEYSRAAGNVVDVFVEPVRFSALARPQLWFFAVAGYFFPHKGNITVVYKLRA